MPKHKCFISYHHNDQDEVDEFVDTFGGGTFITKGITGDEDFINSNDSDYIMRRIREKYISGSTVTIVLLGRCTWARKYVDWEIASSLRNDFKNKRNGLLGIVLNSYYQKSVIVPDRMHANLGDVGFAGLHYYPSSASKLEEWIDSAYEKRDMKPDNSLELFKNNRNC
jgi:Thoeris protein ThsB, TIR-like domain